MLKAKQSNADALFVYTNEEESARALRELRKQGCDQADRRRDHADRPEGDRAGRRRRQRRRGHVGLTVDAPNPLMLKFKAKFYQEYKYISDHNGIKGYTGVYMLKAAIEKVGKLDRKAVAAGAARPERQGGASSPACIMDVTIDDNGDLDRESFIVEVKGGKQVVKEVLPRAGQEVQAPAFAPRSGKATRARLAVRLHRRGPA